MRKAAVEDGKRTLLPAPICDFAWQFESIYIWELSKPVSVHVHLQLTHRASKISTKDNVSDCSTNRVFAHAQNRNLQRSFHGDGLS